MGVALPHDMVTALLSTFSIDLLWPTTHKPRSNNDGHQTEKSKITAPSSSTSRLGGRAGSVATEPETFKTMKPNDSPV